MAQRASGYEKRDADLYPTPAWVVHALAEVVNFKGRCVWEPACGRGDMSEALRACGAAQVWSTDLNDHGYQKFNGRFDFTSDQEPEIKLFDGIVTNPPYGRKQGDVAEAFIDSALRFTEFFGFVAMLLPVDFDSAVTRNKYFSDCPRHAGKIVLTKRIKWFDEPVPCRPCGGTGKINEVECEKCGGKGEKKSGPSANHAWFLWQRTWIGERQIPRAWYAPRRIAA